jgi:hypothetical protein
MTPSSKASVAWAEGLKARQPARPETTIGPMANIRFAREVRAQIDEAVAAGATAHIARMAADDGGAYLTPQVLTGVTHDMRVMRDESFGPVVGIMPVEDDDEAIRLMNDSRFGLTASSGPPTSARRGHRRPDRDRHRVHEPLRLSRPGAVLDRLQGHRPRRGLSVSPMAPDPAEILPSEEDLT